MLVYFVFAYIRAPHLYLIHRILFLEYEDIIGNLDNLCLGFFFAYFWEGSNLYLDCIAGGFIGETAPFIHEVSDVDFLLLDWHQESEYGLWGDDFQIG